jgi:hypothetical protein
VSQPTEQSRTFYRCIEAVPVAERQFWSNDALGEELRPPLTPERRRIWQGVSVYDSLKRAMHRAPKLRPPRRWIAVVRVPLRGPMTYAKTLRDPAHFTLWGEPQALLNCVVPVVEVEPREGMEGH